MTSSPRDAEPQHRPATPAWVKAIGVGILVLVLVAVVILLVGGGQHGPGMHTGAATPSRDGSASGAVGNAGAPVDTAHADRTVDVTALDAMAFEPASVEVSVGETVTFRVTNRGQSVHEFTLGDARMQQEHANAMAHMPEGVHHEQPNTIRLEPGETGELTWQFGGDGVLEFACHEAGHYDAGMHGQIKVG
jgi:uncharacterized cupredoxin-like copper-binding protein